MGVARGPRNTMLNSNPRAHSGWVKSGEKLDTSLFRAAGSRTDSKIGIEAEEWIPGEVHLRHQPLNKRRPENGEMYVRRSPGVAVIAPWVRSRPDRDEPIASVGPGQCPARTAKVGIEWGVVAVVQVGVPARCVRLPDLDQRAANRSSALVQDLARDDDPLADRPPLLAPRSVSGRHRTPRSRRPRIPARSVRRATAPPAPGAGGERGGASTCSVGAIGWDGKTSRADRACGRSPLHLPLALAVALRRIRSCRLRRGPRDRCRAPADACRALQRGDP